MSCSEMMSFICNSKQADDVTQQGPITGRGQCQEPCQQLKKLDSPLGGYGERGNKLLS